VAPTAAILFCRTREEVDSLASTLNGRGYRAEALHGGMDQAQRERVMGRLRSGTTDLLVATDVAARGLDLEQLSHVVNYDVPSSPDAYVHRIGRVGRAGRAGVAITLAEPREHRMLKTIERVSRQKIAVESLPTVADLRARRLELTRSSLQEILASDGDLDSFAVVVESLAEEFDLMDIARAAVKLAHHATGAAADDEDIPEVGDADVKASTKARKKTGAPPAGRTRLWIGAGRNGRMRPNDHGGAIANETSLSGRDIGPIEIADTYSLVEVPADKADEVIAAIKASTIKGRKQTIRRDRA
jgi:ATP-dependent RNA helicase DeaD